MMRVQRTSVLTGNANTMDLDITLAQLHALNNGGLAQVVVPHLTAAEREFLISGVTPAEWGAMIPPEDGDDE